MKSQVLLIVSQVMASQDVILTLLLVYALGSLYVGYVIFLRS